MKPFFWSTIAFLTVLNVHHLMNTPAPGDNAPAVTPTSMSVPDELAQSPVVQVNPAREAERALRHRSSTRHRFQVAEAELEHESN